MTRAHTGNRTRNAPDGRPRGRSAAIRWRIGTVIGRRVFGIDAEAIALEMVVSESSGGWVGAVRVLGGGEPARTLSERTLDVRWQADPELQLIHIDADGFVRATIDTSNGVPRLLYARSGIMGELGLGGGRYEPEGTELTQ